MSGLRLGAERQDRAGTAQKDSRDFLSIGAGCCVIGASDRAQRSTHNWKDTAVNSRNPIDVTVAKVIAAPPDVIYDLVSDITQMAKYSPENTGGEWIEGAAGPVVGARFKGSNRLGKATWSTKPTVTVADRGSEFAFKVPGAAGPVWTYRFEATSGGTLVTESVVQTKRSPLPIRLIQRLNGVTDRAAVLQAGMVTTLDRVATAAITNSRAAAPA